MGSELEQVVGPRPSAATHGDTFTHSGWTATRSVGLRRTSLLGTPKVPFRLEKTTGATKTVALGEHPLLRHPAIHTSTRSATAGRPSACGSTASSISGSIKRHDI